MSERQMDWLSRFPRLLLLYVPWVIVIALLWLPEDVGQVVGRRLVRSLIQNMLAVGVTLGISYYFQKQAAGDARKQGLSLRDVAAAELGTGLGIGFFLPIYGGWVTEELGWAWGAPFYGVFVLYSLHLLLRWRKATRASAATS